MYLISGNGPTADWFRNLQADPVVTVRIDDERREGTGADRHDPDERQRVGDVMGAKYVWGGDPAIGLATKHGATRCRRSPSSSAERRPR